MCCIFTCCGWIIDLVQRVWVFMLTFCMSSAVCCVMLTGSMSGVALGYNYSLAEYMDLKETNVSVYLKRGIFDDDSGEDMGFRRSGLNPPAGENSNPRRSNQIDDERDGLSSERSGRRLDDSLLESNQNHGFEGSLMKLTLSPPFVDTTTPSIPGNDPKMEQIYASYPSGSLDQLKAIQTLIAQRKAAAGRESGLKSTYATLDERYVPEILNAVAPQGRRMITTSKYQRYSYPPAFLPADINPARYAVPPKSVNDQRYWESYKNPPHRMDDYRNLPPRPTPIRYNTNPKRPKPFDETSLPDAWKSLTSIKPEQQPGRPGDLGMNRGIDQFKDKLILDKYEPRMKGAGDSDEDRPKSDVEYYDEDIKGLPVRKKRHVKRCHVKTDRANVSLEKHNRVSDNDEASTEATILISKLYKIDENYITNAKSSDLVRKPDKATTIKDKSGNYEDFSKSSVLMSQLLEKASISKIDLTVNVIRSTDSVHNPFRVASIL